MEYNYAMIGADGQQYGPISLEQIKSWVQEGRLTSDTKVLRSDSTEWKAANLYPELGLAPPARAIPGPLVAPTGPLPGARQAGFNPDAIRGVRRGSSWLFWVAALSLINTIMTATGGGFYFLFGMGITLIASSMGAPAAVSIGLSVIICAMLAGLGWFARKGHAWAFIAGIIIYGLDAVVFLVGQEWLPLAFHGYVIFWMVRGLMGCFQMKSQTN